MSDVDEFNKRMSAKWCLLPYVTTEDLVAELSRREGVFVKKVAKGERFEFYGPGKLVIL